MVEAQDVPIVRRVCPDCSRSHKDIYYRRLSPMPDNFDLLDTLMNNWVDVDNVLNEDFALYSTHLDAYYDVNRWTTCNYNDYGIGFPRDCGPTGLVGGNWNSYYRGGGRAEKHAFLLPANPDFISTRSNIALGDDIRLSTTHQQGVSNGGVPERALDGDTSGIYPWGGVTQSNERQDPYWQVELQHHSTINKVYIWRCIHHCRNGNKLHNITVDVYDHMYGEIVDSRFFSGGGMEKLMVVDFGDAGVEGQVVRITSETNPGKHRTLHLAEVEIDGTLGPAVDHETYAEVDGDEYSEQKGIHMDNIEGEAVQSLDNGDYVTYGSLNFGPSGTTKSVKLRYAKHGYSASHFVEIRLGGSTGRLIGEFNPKNTGSWHTYVEGYAPIEDVEGIHDVTFVGKGGNWVLAIESFELSNIVPLELYAAYKVNDDKAKARDVQCGYDSLLDAYTEQIYEKDSNKLLAAVQEFHVFFLGVELESDTAGRIVDYVYCKAAQDKAKDDRGSGFARSFIICLQCMSSGVVTCCSKKIVF